MLHYDAEKPYSMQVQHKYYVLDKLPWKYPDDALITYCNWCHSEWHQQNKVKVFADEQLTTEVPVSVCSRCSGAGWFPQYKHVENGVCFECNGQRFTVSHT